MKEILKEAKCPHCGWLIKHTFGSDLQCLWGEYACTQTKHICVNCGKESMVSVERKTIYRAKKI